MAQMFNTNIPLRLMEPARKSIRPLTYYMAPKKDSILVLPEYAAKTDIKENKNIITGKFKDLDGYSDNEVTLSEGVIIDMDFVMHHCYVNLTQKLMHTLRDTYVTRTQDEYLVIGVRFLGDSKMTGCEYFKTGHLTDELMYKVKGLFINDRSEFIDILSPVFKCTSDSKSDLYKNVHVEINKLQNIITNADGDKLKNIHSDIAELVRKYSNYGDNDTLNQALKSMSGK